MKLAIGCLALLAVAQVQAQLPARDVIQKLLKRSGIDISAYSSHDFDLDAQRNVLELLQKYNLYDELVSALNKAHDLLIALNDQKDIEGPKLGLVITALKGLRHRLAAKANEDELRVLDGEIDVLSAVRRDGTNALALKKANAILKAGRPDLNISNADLKKSFLKNILESYQSAAPQGGRNPRQVVRASIDALLNLDAAHPLSSSLGQLIAALKEQNDFAQKINHGNGTEIGKQIAVLELAKAHQDDSILDGLSGKALSLYEDLVENLKDLKKELK
uniref:Secreted protein n=2 Tax=Bursaphelenchus xylophilus TaxID=6326 RepID=A0A1I7RYI5_BURXY